MTSAPQHVTPDVRSALTGTVRATDLTIDDGHHHYIVLSHLYRWMREVALPAAGGVLLDYGCGGRAYEQLFLARVERYIGADVAASANTRLDIELEPNGPVPLPDASVDTILSNQTLEHVPDHRFYLRECRRLLRPGGVLILTAPMQWRHHEKPFDFLRFTRYGLVAAIEGEAGCEVQQIAGCGGAYALAGQIVLGHLCEGRRRSRLLIKAINRLALWLDARSPDPDETINWMCLARRSSAS